jgi:hypothetical protein
VRCNSRNYWLAAKVVDAVPTPDPRDDVNYQRLVGLEQSMLARISPRHRNRWPELLAIDERWGSLRPPPGRTADGTRRMRGVTTAELTTCEAIWAGSDADLARQKREKEQLLAAGGSMTVDD